MGGGPGPSRAARAKGGRSRSAAKVAAVRKNGTKGGRVRDRLPDEVIARLRAIPDGTAARRRWLVTWAAEVLIGEADGSIPPELAAKLRVGIAHVQKLLPAATVDEDGDEEDDEDDGPALESDDGSDSVRVDR